MGPHPEAPVDVQKYIGSCLITQQPRSKRKSCPRAPHNSRKDNGGRFHGPSLPSCNHCCNGPLQGGGGGYNGLNNYAWTGVPLISVARHKGGGGHHGTKPRAAPRKPLDGRERSEYHEPPADVNLEEILPIARLAIHAQGAPLILSPKDKEDVEGYTFKGHDFYHHSGHHNGHVYMLMGGMEDLPPSSPRSICYPQEDGESDLLSPRQVSSPSQSDCISTTSEDSGTSENGLPRIIKPRKRRKKDRRTSESDYAHDDVPGSIVTLKPYQPLCYPYNSSNSIAALDTSDLRCDTAMKTVAYPYPPSTRCRCPHCVPPPSTFLTPPDSPVDISEDGFAMAMVRGRRSPPEDPFKVSPPDTEIKFLSGLDDDYSTLCLEEGLFKGQMPNTLVLTSSHPPQRPWISMARRDPKISSCTFTVMCYNILCDKYATRQMYGYCPNWALDWSYRRDSIMHEILHYKADVISLQEVETEQFYTYFLPELKKDGYDGIFSPKSRAKTMPESERKHVDGCAIFYKTSKFFLLKEHLMEFNQLAMANAAGSEDMLNRVMTKDNIGLAALLQTRIGAYSNGTDLSQANQTLLVCTAHIHWDPEYSDVKLIQTMMLMHELKSFVDDILHKCNIPASQKMDPNSIPLLLCGDFNSLPESGVIEYLSSGRVSANHCDFKEFVYKDCLRKICNSSKTNEFTHPFKISRAYSDGIMPFTNYSYGFKGVIDYVLYSRLQMTVLGVLGPVDPTWLEQNRIHGCPHPHIPSDHFPIVVELQLGPTLPLHQPPPNGVTLHR